MVDAPNKFVDVQEKGPYALWRHSHSFKDIGSGATEMKDRVEYAMPLGPLGEIAYHFFVSAKPRADFRVSGEQAGGDYGELDREAMPGNLTPNPFPKRTCRKSLPRTNFLTGTRSRILSF